MGWLGFSRNIQSTESGIRYQGNRELVHGRGHNCARAHGTMPESGFRRQLTKLQSQCGYRRRSRSLLSCSLAVAQTKMITLATPMATFRRPVGLWLSTVKCATLGCCYSTAKYRGFGGVLFPGRRRKMAREWELISPQSGRNPVESGRNLMSHSGGFSDNAANAVLEGCECWCCCRDRRGKDVQEWRVVGRYIEVIPARSMMALGSGDSPKLSTSSVSLAGGMDCWGNIGGGGTQGQRRWSHFGQPEPASLRSATSRWEQTNVPSIPLHLEPSCCAKFKIQNRS
jgi:hypothetical protein